MNLLKREYNQQQLSASQIDKIGNAIIFLSEKINPLYKTSALKLLYLLEEISIKKYGIPYFGVNFQLWRLGPVIKEVFVDLSSQPLLLNKYIQTIYDGDSTIISPKAPFNDDEFSDYDLEILSLVVDSFKDKSAPDLVKITHRENSPWYKTAKESGYFDAFEKNMLNSTDIVLDLSSLLDDAPTLKEFYLANLDIQMHSNQLKHIG